MPVTSVGASLMLATFRSKVSDTDAVEPSVAVTRTERVATSLFEGVPEKVRVGAETPVVTSLGGYPTFNNTQVQGVRY